MNYIWGGLIVISIIFGTTTGRLDDVVNAMLTSVKSAVEIALALVGVMAFWLGMVRIAQKTGLVAGFAKLIAPVLRLIFNELPKESPAFSNIALNFSANALGLANAATPFGIKAMQDLKNEAVISGEKRDMASNSMCIFLGMNTAGFQLIPASVIAILIAAHAKNPTEIILPTLIVTSIAFICAIIIAKVLAPFFKTSEGTPFFSRKRPDIKGFSAKNKPEKGLLKQKFLAKTTENIEHKKTEHKKAGRRLDMEDMEYKPQIENVEFSPQFQAPKYSPQFEPEKTEHARKLKRLKNHKQRGF